MTLTEQIADRVEDLDAHALFEEAHRRRKKRWVLTSMFGISLVLVGNGLAWLIAQDGQSRPRSSSTTPTGSTNSWQPSEAVALTANLEIVSTRDGRLVRTLVRYVGLYRGGSTPSVSNGGVVYFDNASNPHGVPLEQVFSVPVTGGSPKLVAEGRDPAVSPNGSQLAYVTYTDISNVPEAIVVTDLATGTTKSWVAPVLYDDIGSLSWAPDSRRLSFAASPTVGKRTFSVLDTSIAGGSLTDAQVIPLASRVEWACFLDNGTGIGVIQRSDFGGVNGRESLVIADASTGRVLRHLATIRGPQFSSIGGAPGGTFSVDRSGKYLLAAGIGSGYGGLYTVDIATGRLFKISGRVDAASWVPNS